MAKIARIETWDDGPALVVPGTDPEQILKDAQGELDDNERVLTPLEKVKVEWWRVNPCHESNCYDGGGHYGHWTQTRQQTRGGFQAAMVYLGWADES